MGVPHLALSDLNKKFKELGHIESNKTYLPTEYLYEIIKDKYPRVATKFDKLNLDNVEQIMQELGFEYRLERKVIKPNKPNKQTDKAVVSKPKTTSSQRKLLKLFKNKGYVTEDTLLLTGEVIRTVLETHHPNLIAKIPVITEGRSNSIYKLIKAEFVVKKRKPIVVTKPKVILPKGIDVTSKEFLATWEWKTLRYEVLVEQGARCKCCGATAADGIVINVDHIKPRRTHPELALVKSNLQVLCSDCNMGKGSWDTTNWNE